MNLAGGVVCPRCDKANVYRQCPVCGLCEFSQNSKKEPLYMLSMKCGELYWVSGQCLLYPRAYSQAIKLPLLPFNVSEEDVMKYLMLV
jgi:hypothetical protein